MIPSSVELPLYHLRSYAKEFSALASRTGQGKETISILDLTEEQKRMVKDIMWKAPYDAVEVVFKNKNESSHNLVPAAILYIVRRTQKIAWEIFYLPTGFSASTPSAPIGEAALAISRL